MVFIWCIAHRLKLALSDALKTIEFQEVDDMLLKMYLLYKKAPKKLRQLEELHDLYQQTMRFEEGGVKPEKIIGVEMDFSQAGCNEDVSGQVGYLHSAP